MLMVRLAGLEGSIPDFVVSVLGLAVCMSGLELVR